MYYNIIKLMIKMVQAMEEELQNNYQHMLVNSNPSGNYQGAWLQVLLSANRLVKDLTDLNKFH